MPCRKAAANVRKFQDIPIRQKLMVIIMVASTVALLLVAAGFVAYDLDTFRKKMVNDLSTLAEIIGDRSEAALSFKDQAVAQDMLHALVYQKHIVAAALYDAGGKLFARYPQNARATSFPDPPASAAAPQFGRDRLGRNGLMLFHKIYAGPDLVGTLYLESDLQAQNELLAHYAGIVLLLISVSWLLTLMLSGRLQRVISRPIFDLAETARTVSAGKDYSVRATRHGGDELGRLTDDFNEMLGQIQRRDGELQKARDELEIRVQERTQDLEHAYDELRRTQAAVLQQERLKALGQMASGIAHDVTNAISPVVGFSELLLKQECGLNQEGNRFLNYIRTAGRDVTHIIARLREFYRKHEDTESLQRLNLNALVEQVVGMTRPRWRDITQSNGITIEMSTELAPEVPELVGIESEIREAFTNLVLNAVDAMPAGGKITLRTSVSHREDAGRISSHVIVDIIDTGVGMNEETRKRCLEPFFSTKGKRGTGLGLAMVYGVIQRHEGSVEIQSAPGQGTTFRLIFPVRDQLRDTVEQEEEETLEPVAPLRILCIDDEPLLRELLKEMLGRDGHDVEVSDSGQSGLDQFRFARERGRPFDVVITDLGMPYVDGRQVAKTVKQESPGTPVVMLTGWGALIKEDDNVPAQVDVVLSKPPGSREMRKVLSRLQAAARRRSRE
ncbi:MAG TPA: ATP-binding protein [Verrucomicrobiae bacterium]|nr:ATP-binding protein [Verrucomicrobiae bacterium]